MYWNSGAGSSYSILSSGLPLTTQFSTTSVEPALTLQSTTPYKFKVIARNAVGYGFLSSALTVYAASVPDAPTGLQMLSQSET